MLYSFNFGNGYFNLFKHNHLIAKALNFLKLYIMIFMDLLMLILSEKERYFITFVDDYSRYGYVYLLHEKSQAVNTLKIYLNEVERQLNRKVKVVRSNRGGEHYGRYNETKQHQVHFLYSFRNMTFVHNTRCPIHHNKIVYWKGVIEL